MHVLIGIVLKSLLIAGVTLGMLQLLRRRSAAERSWVAHIGLLALVVMALAPLVLPSWNVEAPALLGQAPEAAPAAQAAPSAAGTPRASIATKVLPKPETTVDARPAFSAAATAAAIYAVPAAILLFITLLALARLVTLRARAEVLVDGHWLSALARAQRRMGFKHGTALLTSNELSSPISWGMMRPVILLNNRAVEASDEAEAIIAHELAHVARLDWVKLLLSRIATALFWFNPLVWLLAREAHQLREEAADDAVLGADIADTDYAQLLVGIARHECRSLLIGAHGVAPSKGSLARRVARVLDAGSERGPVARSFVLGVFVGAMAIAAPLAALTLTPKGAPAVRKNANDAHLVSSGDGSAYYSSPNVPADLPSIISQGVATSVQTAVSAVRPNVNVNVDPDEEDFETTAPSGASVKRVNGVTTARSPSGATVTVYPPDAQGRRKVVARSATGATAISYVDADSDVPFADVHRQKHEDAIEQAVEMKALGVTPEYVAAMRAVAPRLRASDNDDFVQMKALGITPDYVRDLASAGFNNLDADGLTEARAVGVTGAYIRQKRAAGYNGDLDDFVEMKAVESTGSGYDPPRPPQPPRPAAPSGGG